MEATVDQIVEPGQEVCIQTNRDNGQDEHIVTLDPIKRTDVTFIINYTALPGEHVSIVGNGEELGQWDSKKSILMEASPLTFPAWKVTVNLPANVNFEYKYVVRVESQTNKNFLLLRRWEKLEENRSITPTGVEMEVRDGDFGRKNEKEDVSVDEGWLQDEVEFRLKIGARNQQPINWEITTPFTINISSECLSDDGIVHTSQMMKLQVLKFAEDENGNVTKNTSSIFVPHEGWRWDPHDLGIFSCRFKKNEPISSVTIQFISDDEQRTILGQSIIIAHQFQGSSGTFYTPIINQNRAIGSFFVEYLIITPFEHPNISMRTLKTESFRSLSIGHRGSGQTHEEEGAPKMKKSNSTSYLNRPFYKVPEAQNDSKPVIVEETNGTNGINGVNDVKVKDSPKIAIQTDDDDGPKYHSIHTENTISSFIHATKNGVDFVEFDVQLTKDRIPIVYHNFETRVGLEKDFSSIMEAFDIEVNKLTLKQIRSLKLDFVSNRKTKMFTKLLKSKLPQIIAMGNSADPKLVPMKPIQSEASKNWERIKNLKDKIPTLEEVFKNVPIQTGFNIEIKYPVPLQGEDDRDDWEDHNSYVDAILKVIFENAKDRRIVISCFEPDLCAILKLKQPVYPIFFLTTGGHPRYGANKDRRANSIADAVLYAASQKFMGIVPFSTPLLENPSYITLTKDYGLLLYTWGSANNVLKNKLIQLQLGVDAVIADNITILKKENEVIN